MQIQKETYDQKNARISAFLRSNDHYTPVPVSVYLESMEHRTFTVPIIIERIKEATSHSKILVMRHQRGLNCMFADTAAGAELIRRGKGVVGVFDKHNSILDVQNILRNAIKDLRVSHERM